MENFRFLLYYFFKICYTNNIFIWWVIILEEEKEEGISLLDICKILWKKKIWIAIITAVTTIIVLLLVLLWYNPSKTNYSTSFEIKFNGLENLQYPNGEPFNYQDIISKERLVEVKNTSDEFKKLDVEYLYDEGYITISKTATQNETEKFDKYTIDIQKSKVTDTKTIRSFILELIQNIKTEIESKSQMNLADYMDDYNQFRTYRELIQYINSQQSYILDKYEELTFNNGDEFIVDGHPLRYYRQQAERILEEIDTNYYSSQVDKYNYVKDSGYYLTYTNTRINSLIKRKEKNNQIIIELKKIASEIFNDTDRLASISTQMEEIARDNAEIMTELESLAVDVTVESSPAINQAAKNENGEYVQLFYLTEKTSEAEKQIKYALRKYVDGTTDLLKEAYDEFDKTMAEAYDNIKTLTTTLGNNLSSINLNSFALNYTNNRVVKQSGSLSVILSLAGGIVVGLIFSAAVVLIWYYVKKDNGNSPKEEKEE